MPSSCELLYRRVSPRTSNIWHIKDSERLCGINHRTSKSMLQRKTERGRFNWRLRNQLPFRKVETLSSPGQNGTRGFRKPVRHSSYLPQLFIVFRRCGLAVSLRVHGSRLQAGVRPPRDSTRTRPFSRPNSGHASAPD